MRRITIEKEACKKLSNHQSSSKSKNQTKAALKCDKMSMVSFDIYEKFLKITEIRPSIDNINQFDIRVSDRPNLNREN